MISPQSKWWKQHSGAQQPSFPKEAIDSHGYGKLESALGAASEGKITLLHKGEG